MRIILPSILKETRLDLHPFQSQASNNLSSTHVYVYKYTEKLMFYYYDGLYAWSAEWLTRYATPNKFSK